MENFDLENTLGYLINRCAILLKSELTHRFKQAGHDVTPEEWAILNRLWEQDGLSQNKLAERTVKDKTTITRFLNQMEKKGLVARQSSNQDGRFKKVYLTPNAKELETILIEITQGMLSGAAADISAQSLQITLNTLRTIENNLLNMES